MTKLCAKLMIEMLEIMAVTTIQLWSAEGLSVEATSVDDHAGSLSRTLSSLRIEVANASTLVAEDSSALES